MQPASHAHTTETPSLPLTAVLLVAVSLVVGAVAGTVQQHWAGTSGTGDTRHLQTTASWSALQGEPMASTRPDRLHGPPASPARELLATIIQHARSMHRGGGRWWWLAAVVVPWWWGLCNECNQPLPNAAHSQWREPECPPTGWKHA
jgi:hypothetical protein